MYSFPCYTLPSYHTELNCPTKFTKTDEQSVSQEGMKVWPWRKIEQCVGASRTTLCSETGDYNWSNDIREVTKSQWQLK